MSIMSSTSTNSIATVAQLVASLSDADRFSSESSNLRMDQSTAYNIDTEFFESEALYLAALETLWIAYLQPLCNATIPSPCAQKKHDGQRSSDRRNRRDSECGRSTSQSSVAPAIESATLEETFGADILQMIACHSMIMQQLVEGSFSSSSPDDPSSVGSPVYPPSSSPDGGALDSSSEVRVQPAVIDAEAFPSVLLRMTPTMADAYTRYVTNFSKNIDAVEAARENVPAAIWDNSFAALAAMTIREKLRPWQERFPILNFDIMLLTFDISFTALVTLPVQRIARYSLLIQEWVRCDAAQNRQNEGETASPLRKCKLEQHARGIAAANQMHVICESVNHIRSSTESTKRLIAMEQKLGLSNGGLSQYTGQVIVHESPLHKAKLKGKGVYHLKPCYAVLLDRLLVVVQCRDEGLTKYKHILRIPLCAIHDVRRLTSSPQLAKDIEGTAEPACGFVVRFPLIVPQDTFVFRRRSAPEPQCATPSRLEELVLLDDDEIGCGLWISELTLQVHRVMEQRLCD